VKRALSAVFLIALLALAGCGSSSDSSSSSIPAEAETGASAETNESTGATGATTPEETAPPPTREGATHDAFVAEADELCERHAQERQELDRQVQELAPKIAKSQQAREELAGVQRELVEAGEEDIEAIRALNPPAEDHMLLQSIFEAAESSFAKALQFDQALEDGDEVHASQLGEAANAKAIAVANLSRRFGFEVCGGVQ
jgi:hypothetical protein